MTTKIQRQQRKNKRKLHLCIIFPDINNFTAEMEYNVKVLNQVKDFEIVAQFIHAGEFSHRHTPDKADKIQCYQRNRYLKAVPDGEWLIILDTDEIIFGALDQLVDVIDIADENDLDWIGISEVRPDMHTSIRPRIIKKREGMLYGSVPNSIGVMYKHDVIGYEGRNYIDVSRKDRCLYYANVAFFHNKNAPKLDVYPDGRVVKMPENMVKTYENNGTCDDGECPHDDDCKHGMNCTCPCITRRWVESRTAYKCVCGKMAYPSDPDFEHHDIHMTLEVS